MAMQPQRLLHVLLTLQVRLLLHVQQLLDVLLTLLVLVSDCVTNKTSAWHTNTATHLNRF